MILITNASDYIHWLWDLSTNAKLYMWSNAILTAHPFLASFLAERSQETSQLKKICCHLLISLLLAEEVYSIPQSCQCFLNWHYKIVTYSRHLYKKKDSGKKLVLFFKTACVWRHLLFLHLSRNSIFALIIQNKYWLLYCGIDLLNPFDINLSNFSALLCTKKALLSNCDPIVTTYCHS